MAEITDADIKASYGLGNNAYTEYLCTTQRLQNIEARLAKLTQTIEKILDQLQKLSS